MCGRYLFFDQKNETIAQLIEAARNRLPAQVLAQLSLLEVYPGDYILAGIYDPQKGSFRMAAMHWGYGSSHGMIINRRSETLTESSFFAGSEYCAIPCCGYYEWSNKPHQKYYFTTENPPVYLAGCWKPRRSHGSIILDCAILTEEAGEPQRQIHSRQPVLFDYETAHAWCRTSDQTSLLSHSLRQRLISPAQNKEPR